MQTYPKQEVVPSHLDELKSKLARIESDVKKLREKERKAGKVEAAAKPWAMPMKSPFTE